MNFINECGCLVENEILIKAINAECERRGVKAKDNYKIYNYRGYAAISIKHDKVDIHRMIGNLINGKPLTSDIHVHHKDGNKNNNSLENLQLLTNSEHSKETYAVQFVSLEKIRANQKKAVEKNIRSDVSEEIIQRMRNQGLSYTEISEKLNCGKNTVYRRLKKRA